jgi:hypothetical protein
LESVHSGIRAIDGGVSAAIQGDAILIDWNDDVFVAGTDYLNRVSRTGTVDGALQSARAFVVAINACPAPALLSILPFCCSCRESYVRRCP